MSNEQPIRIVFVEDVPYDAELAERVLRKEGLVFTATRVETKNDLQAALATFRPDLIISDYTLPEFDGMQALRLSLEDDAARPVIVLTGTLNEETAVACIKAGATDYVLKDRLARLPFAVKEALAQKQTRQAKEIAERALRESEKKYQILTEISPVGVFKTDAQGATTYVNPRWSQISGLPAEEALGDGWLNSVPLEDREKIGVNWKQATDAQIASTAEYRFVRPDGSVAWVLGQAIPERNTQNQIIGYVGTITDITELKAAQKKLATSEAELRALFAAMHDVVLVIDRDGVYREIAPTNPHLLYKPPAELIGKSLAEVFPQVEADQFLSTTRDVLTTGQSKQIEYQLRIGDGQHWFAANITPMSEDLTVWVAHDITDRKQAADEIRRLKEFDETLINDMVEGIVVQNTDGFFTFVNPAVFDITGYSSKEILGEHWTKFIPVDQHELIRAADERRLAGEASRYEVDFLHKRGQRINLLVSGSPLFENGRFIGPMAVFTDITDRKRAEDAIHQLNAELEQRVIDRTRELAIANERLLELDRLKSKFVSDVSHELRTPVTSLSLYVDLLDRGRPEKREFYVVQLRQQMARLRTLIEEILDLARLERDQLEVSRSQIDLNSIVEHVVATQQAAAEAAGLRLTCEVTEQMPLVLAQPEQLSRAVTNLVANAIKYTRSGTVQVKTDAIDKRVCIAVTDTGIGTPEDIPHLFERFYRGKQVAQSAIPGTGLGLAIVKEIIEAHGGRVEVESRLDVGSTFWLWLPATVG